VVGERQAVDAALQRVAEAPLSFPIVTEPPSVWRALVPGFLRLGGRLKNASLHLMIAAARKLPVEAKLPEQSAPKRPSAREFLARGLAGADVSGFVEAAKKYDGDVERELADLEAGRHPLQRRKPTR